MPIPTSVAELIDRFARNEKTYASSDYNETQLRREFLDPLFAALGWDMTNSAGYADAYKDVIHEDSIKITGAGGGTKAPDYCFRIGGARKFFLEAKKPSIDIKGDPSPAYQLRRYAWSAKLPLSVLSDFQEFAIYDTRIKPDVSDKSSTARIFYCRYTDLPEKWEEIAAILSKDAILKGAFDKYAASTRSKRGTAQVDDAFLQEIEKWRDAIAANLALRNPDISERDLNVAVTKTIDRIVFLRICEDRGIEVYAQLHTIAKTNDIYGELLKLFRRADEKYNSGLFHFSKDKDRPEQPDTLTPAIDIDDKVLRPILTSLYYPDCPYEFSVLPADILGHVYEQFLGKIIRLTPGHRAKVEEKPEVRKAGGVYYTPTYIVDYIVQNTVGKLLGNPAPDAPIAPGLPGGTAPQQSALASAPSSDNPAPKNLTPKDAAKLKILDPACGSGSFLLGAYQFLLDWHLRYYAAHSPEQLLKQKNPPIYQTTAKSNQIAPGSPGIPSNPTADLAYKLTTSERKRILLNNIFGVDIDQNAVETTKLSLLLKVLEGESQESLANQLKLFRQRTLPDLANNIKCGNSLIASDFYRGEQLTLLDNEDIRYRINSFDWVAEFGQVMRSGGFDAVIGNPPYVNIENIEPRSKTYFLAHYGENGRLGKRYDLYQVFVLKGATLLREKGRLGFITPNTFLMGHSYEILRRRIIESCRINKIVDLPQGVFRGVTVDNVLLFLTRDSSHDTRRANVIQICKLGAKSDKERVATEFWDDQFEIHQGTLIAEQDYKINVHANPTTQKLFNRIEAGTIPLGQLTESSQGIILYRTEDEAIAAKHTSLKKQPGWKKLLRGRNIARYETKWAGEYVNYGDGLWCRREERFFNQPKILLHAMRNKSLQRRLVATLDAENYYNAHNLANIIAKKNSTIDLRYVLAIFNSGLINFWYKAHYPNVNINPSDFRNIPIKTISPANSQLVIELIHLVDTMLSLHRQLAKAHSGREQIQRQISATDHQIDALVYDLYQLSPDEIQLIESATNSAAIS